MSAQPDPSLQISSRRRREDLARLVTAYFRAAKRDLPWRRTRDPYAIWVSEIMLQQTRVATVIPYFEQWMSRFPTVQDLARAQVDDVLAAWSGLGYYSRARNLHRGAGHVLAHFAGSIPASVDLLRQIPGIGAYTAGAIASIAFDLPAPLVDGNVARVLARLFAVEGNVKSSAVNRTLWNLAGVLVPEHGPGDFNQGLMELGATICTPTRPDCPVCPVRSLCRARAAGRELELPEMPARKPAKSLPLINARALWIVQKKRVILARRAPQGLYGGLWELPQSEDPHELESLVKGARLVDSRPLVDHRQTLTHRRLRIRVYPAELAGDCKPGRRKRGMAGPATLGKSAAERYDKLAWHALSAASRRGLSAATRTIIDRLLEKK